MNRVQVSELKALRRLTDERIKLADELAKLDQKRVPVHAVIELGFAIEPHQIRPNPDNKVTLTSGCHGPTAAAVVTFMRSFFIEEISRVDGELRRLGLTVTP